MVKFNQIKFINANKISLSQRKKTEMVIFKSKQKKFEGDLEIKLPHRTLNFKEA